VDWEIVFISGSNSITFQLALGDHLRGLHLGTKRTTAVGAHTLRNLRNTTDVHLFISWTPLISGCTPLMYWIDIWIDFKLNIFHHLSISFLLGNFQRDYQCSFGGFGEGPSSGVIFSGLPWSNRQIQEVFNNFLLVMYMLCTNMHWLILYGNSSWKVIKSPPTMEQEPLRYWL